MIEMTDSSTAYRIMALGPFAPVPEEKFTPEFVQVDLYSLDEAVAAVAPVLYLPLSTDYCPEGAVTLRFNSMKDFKPGQIVKNTPSLNAVPAGGSGLDPADVVKKSTRAVDDLLSMVDGPETGSAGSGRDAVLKAIFEDDMFTRMESAWKGVQTLVKQADIKGFEKNNLSVSPISRSSLSHVLAAIEALPREQMPNLLMIDLEFDYSQPSMELLKTVVEFAENMMVPTCVWLGSDFFRIESWALMHKIPYIKNHLDDMLYVKFRKLQGRGGASWLMFCCNRFAVRNPHPFETMPLMGAPVWAVGTLCAKSVQETGWPMGFTNYVDCFLENLPVFSNDNKSMAATQAIFSEDRIAQLLEAGITPVVGPKNKDTALIPEAVSLAGDPIRFQMFFNRIIGILMAIQERSAAIVDPEKEILSVINNLFTRTGHPEPENLSVIQAASESEGQRVFDISFVPPGSVPGFSGEIHFSFLWKSE